MRQIILLAAITFIGYKAKAQVNLGSSPNNLDNRNTFFDASGFTKYDATIGKGLNFPRTDLTTWKFNLEDLGKYQFFPTAYDGMIVYNIKTGKTGGDPATQGQQVNVEPGFYYFYNPNATEDTNDVSAGRWVRIGGGNASLSSNIVRGTFDHKGGNSAVLDNNMPTDIKSIVSVKIARTNDIVNNKLEGGVMATTFYSYDKSTRTMVFGQGAISTSMPAGTYTYEIEYTK